MAFNGREFATCLVYHANSNTRKVRKNKKSLNVWTVRCHRCAEPLKESDSLHVCPHGRACVQGFPCAECVAFMARQLTLDELVGRE